MIFSVNQLFVENLDAFDCFYDSHSVVVNAYFASDFLVLQFLSAFGLVLSACWHRWILMWLLVVDDQ